MKFDINPIMKHPDTNINLNHMTRIKDMTFKIDKRDIGKINTLLRNYIGDVFGYSDTMHLWLIIRQRGYKFAVRINVPGIPANYALKIPYDELIAAVNKNGDYKIKASVLRDKPTPDIYTRPVNSLRLMNMPKNFSNILYCASRTLGDHADYYFAPWGILGRCDQVNFIYGITSKFRADDRRFPLIRIPQIEMPNILNLDCGKITLDRVTCLKSVYYVLRSEDWLITCMETYGPVVNDLPRKQYLMASTGNIKVADGKLILSSEYGEFQK